MITDGKKSKITLMVWKIIAYKKELFLSWQGGIKLITYLGALLLKGMPEPFYIITTSLAMPHKCNV
jgi:hypothetical protein